MSRAVVDRIECADCGRELEVDPAESDFKRTPCPNCGSMRRAIEGSVDDMGAVGDLVAKPRVRRGVTSERLTVLAIIIATSLTVGIATYALIGLATAAGLVLIFAVPYTRHLLMEAAHRLSGR